MPSRLTGFVCPTVSMVTTSHATGLEKTLLGNEDRRAVLPFGNYLDLFCIVLYRTL